VALGRRSPEERGETASGPPAPARPGSRGGPAATDGDRRAAQEAWRSRPAWLASGTVAALVAEAGLERHHPALEMVIVACAAGVPVLLALILVAVILCGSQDKQDRVFRLLRWIRDKPEPPGPPGPESREVGQQDLAE
jgi:hypothetical protein